MSRTSNGSVKVHETAAYRKCCALYGISEHQKSAIRKYLAEHPDSGLSSRGSVANEEPLCVQWDKASRILYAIDLKRLEQDFLEIYLIAYIRVDGSHGEHDEKTPDGEAKKRLEKAKAAGIGFLVKDVIERLKDFLLS